MCYPNLTALKFVAISMFMKWLYIYKDIASSLEFVSPHKKNIVHAITPPKAMQTLLFYQL